MAVLPGGGGVAAPRWLPAAAPCRGGAAPQAVEPAAHRVPAAAHDALSARAGGPACAARRGPRRGFRRPAAADPPLWGGR